MLEAVDQRVGAIALIHEQLHQASPFEDVNVADYLEKLGGLLQRSAPDGVVVDLQVDSVKLNSRLASSVGVIVSEFVMNAFKHAFPAGREGWVKISLRIVSDGLLELRCADNGVGVGAAKREDSSGLGLRIIAASAAQLGGELKTDAADDGFQLSLEFPIEVTP
jgi:two-component sensor histidine kinase